MYQNECDLDVMVPPRKVRTSDTPGTNGARPTFAGYVAGVDANGLLASLFISSIGLVTFLYGKKQGRVPQLVIGLVLVVYTYFLSSIAWMFGIAAVLLGLLWLAVRLGW
jgi:hypothetical protein